MVYRFGDCTLDTQRHQLQRAGQPVRLRAKAFQVLCYLLEHRDRTVLKAELCAQVWPQAFISEATLESTVRAVRQAIGDSGRAQQLIHTIYGYGYHFVAAVEEGSSVPPSTAGDALRALPGSVAAPPLDDDRTAAAVPGMLESAGDDGRRAPGLRDEGRPTPQQEAPALHPTTQAGEWKLVTGMCCAPVATSSGGTQQDAEVRYRQFAHLYALAQRVMQLYGGTLQPMLGDHVLVVFGAPVAQEDHAQRAVLAALELQRRVREADPERGTPPAEGLALRVGLDTGQVVVGPIAEDPSGATGVIGAAVSRALALQAQTAPGTILCSDAMAHLVQGMARVAAVSPVPISGEPAPVAAYTVLGSCRRRRPFRARKGRAWSPFVGRRHELATLRALLTQVEESRGQVVGMIGEPGVGKSRLCYEFIRGSLSHPWVILETQGTAYGQATPYLPVIDLLKGYFRIDQRDDLRTIREKVTAKLHRLDNTLTPTTPAFLTLLDVPVEDPPWQALEGPQRRQRTLDAIKRLLLWESQIQPMLLVVENLHWVDTETQAVLDTLVESLPAAQLFLLTTYRPEYQHGWGNKTYYTQLRLDPLPRQSALELVNSLLGDDATLVPLKQLLIERTEGNPFFLEENVRTLVEIQALIGARAAYRLAQALPSIQVPATVQAVLAARMDRLPPEEKRLLQTAAVIGTEVPFPLLQAVAQLPEEKLPKGLAHLQGAEFLYETSLFPELTYTFKHALTQEVAYGSMLQDRRRAIHARIVSAIETLYAERLAEQGQQLAHHAFRAEVWDKALVYCRQAGLKAAARPAHREAVVYYEQVLTGLQHLPKSCEMLAQAIDLRFDLRTSLLPLGEYGRLQDYLCEAESLAIALDDQRRLGQVSLFLSSHFHLRGAYDHAITSGQRALTLGAASGDVVLQALANLYLGRAYHAQGLYRRAIDCFSYTVASLDGARRHERFGNVNLPAVVSPAWLAACHAELGTFTEGSALGEEGLRIAGAVDHPGSLMFAYWGIGILALRQGDLPRALPLLEQATRICQDTDLPLFFARMATALGAAYILSGRVADAMPLLTQAMEQTIAVETVVYQVLCRLSLGEAQMLAGRLEKAHPLAERALALSREHQERGHQAYALRLLGDIAARRNPPEVELAETHYRQALALAEELGMRPLIAHCHFGLGTLYAKIGRPEQARPELTAAIELYRSMEMTFWLPKAETMLAHMSE